MTYLGNSSIPLTPDEELILADLVALGAPGQVPAVNASGTGLEYIDISGSSNTFETVSANLSAYDYTINYNGSGDVSSIVYSNGVTKTLNYTSGNVTSIVLSGSTPSNISLTKTLTYTSGDVTGITYS
jgi:hypothetical protein